MKHTKSSENNSSIDMNTREAYLLEKALAKKMKDASREERKELYSSVYDKYYDKFPQHPFIFKKEDLIKCSTALQMHYLKGFLKPDMVFLEIGPGTGALSVEVAKYVDTVYALDVSDKPSKSALLPPNVKIVISNGVNIPRSIKSAQIVYSNQVMEHLHPDDVLEQLKDIYDVLTIGGIYICRTPHRYSGPHDISKHFDNVATCFHLKEYTVSELTELFKLAGFRKVRYEIIPKGVRLAIPLLVIKIVEMLLANLSFSFKRVFTRNLPLRPLFNFCIIGTKCVK